MDNIVRLVVSALSGLVAIIPLVYQLIKYVKKAVQEKNWNELLKLVMKYMETAEGKFETGADKKQWVMAMIKASADTINYQINLEEVSVMIDELCKMSKQVNVSDTKKDGKKG